MKARATIFSSAASKPGIGSKVGNALLSAFSAFLDISVRICLGILKEIGVGVLAVVRAVACAFVETLIEQRWFILIGVTLMGLLWFWMQNDPHRPRTRPYHADPAPGRIMR